MTADRGPLTGHPAGEQPLVECGKCSMPPEAVGDALADAYNALHDEELSLFPDAHETLDRLKESGVKLARQPSRSALRSCVLPSNTVSTTSRSRASMASASPRSGPTSMLWECSESGRTRPGWSATTLNGRSWRPNGLASTQSGTMVTASAYPPTPRSAPTESSAVYQNCWSSRTFQYASLAVVLLWSITGDAVSAQTGGEIGHDQAAATKAICRQYAAAQRGMPYETMYAQCMYARGYRVPGFAPSPNAPGYQGELPGPAAHDGGA